MALAGIELRILGKMKWQYRPLHSVLRSGLVLFFCYFWTNCNCNWFPNMEIQKKTRLKPQKTTKNQSELV